MKMRGGIVSWAMVESFFIRLCSGLNLGWKVGCQEGGEHGPVPSALVAGRAAEWDLGLAAHPVEVAEGAGTDSGCKALFAAGKAFFCFTIEPK